VKINSQNAYCSDGVLGFWIREVFYHLYLTYVFVGGHHHDSREKLKSSLSTATPSEKSKQTSKGKSSHSTGGSENSPKRVQSGSVHAQQLLLQWQMLVHQNSYQ
jgi:hypothetical protein